MTTFFLGLLFCSAANSHAHANRKREEKAVEVKIQKGNLHYLRYEQFAPQRHNISI